MTIEEMLINQGVEKGSRDTAAKAVLRLLERRGLAPSDAERARVQAITDVSLLEHLIERAVEVTSVAELFAN